MTTIMVLVGVLSIVLTIASFFAGRRLGSASASTAHFLELSRLQSESQEARSRVETDFALTRQSLEQAEARADEFEGRVVTLEQRLQDEASKLSESQVALSIATTKVSEGRRQLEEVSREGDELARRHAVDQETLRVKSEALGAVPALEAEVHRLTASLAEQAKKADANARELITERDELLKKREADQQRLEQQAQALGGLSALKEDCKRLNALVADHKDREDAARRDLIAARERVTELETAALKDRESLERERLQFNEVVQGAEKQFQNIALKIIDEKQAMFQEQSKNGLGALLSPLKQQLERFRQRVDEVHTKNVEGTSTLRAELQNLRELNQRITTEASNLTKALKGDKKVQGNWGEMKVELLLEQSNLRKGFEYEREKTLHNEDSERYRPDFLVKLPEGKHIINDSKVSLVAYNDYVAAETEEARQIALQAHIQAFRNHILGLSAKAYPELIGVNSPDFVFMFVGIEPAYLTLAEHVPSLFQEAYDKRIAIVTATTLVPVLRVVSNLWMLQQRNQSTKELADQAASVYDKLRGFCEKMVKLGSQIETVGKTYKDAFSTLKDGQGSLTNKVDKFVELGVKVRSRLPASVVTEDALAELESANAGVIRNEVAPAGAVSGASNDAGGEDLLGTAV